MKSQENGDNENDDKGREGFLVMDVSPETYKEAHMMEFNDDPKYPSLLSSVAYKKFEHNQDKMPSTEGDAVGTPNSAILK